MSDSLSPFQLVLVTNMTAYLKMMQFIRSAILALFLL